MGYGWHCIRELYFLLDTRSGDRTENTRAKQNETKNTRNKTTTRVHWHEIVPTMSDRDHRCSAYAAGFNAAIPSDYSEETNAGGYYLSSLPKRPSSPSDWQSHASASSSSSSSSFAAPSQTSQRRIHRQRHSGDESRRSDPSVVQKPRRKTSRYRRKRHTPAGPAGVLFESQLHQRLIKGSSSRIANHDETTGNRFRDASSWMEMHLDMDLLTPYTHSYFTPLERYNLLRKYLPSKYTLLHEVYGGKFQFKVHQTLLLHVSTLQSTTYCDLTVELYDECGFVINAWISPALVKKEEQTPTYLRQGAVWSLRDCMTVTEDEQIWLLVEETNILRIWTGGRKVSNEAYLEWVQNRNALSTAGEAGNTGEHDDGGDDKDNDPEGSCVDGQVMELRGDTEPLAIANTVYRAAQPHEITPEQAGRSLPKERAESAERRSNDDDPTNEYGLQTKPPSSPYVNNSTSDCAPLVEDDDRDIDETEAVQNTESTEFHLDHIPTVGMDSAESADSCAVVKDLNVGSESGNDGNNLDEEHEPEHEGGNMGVDEDEDEDDGALFGEEDF